MRRFDYGILDEIWLFDYESCTPEPHCFTGGISHLKNLGGRCIPPPTMESELPLAAFSSSFTAKVQENWHLDMLVLNIELGAADAMKQGPQRIHSDGGGRKCSDAKVQGTVANISCASMPH